MTEDKLMPGVREAWEVRVAALGLKRGTRKYIDQQLSFAQGVLATATACGAMTLDRAHQIAFLAAVDRLDDWLTPKE